MGEQGPDEGTHVGGVRKGEEQDEGQESGRHDTGTDDTRAQRPTGTSDARDVTSVDPQDPQAGGTGKG
jgi:hypothetical protein